jgi:hypothetical protein
MYHNCSWSCCTKIMRWRSARHIQISGKENVHTAMQQKKKTLDKRSHGRQIWRTLDILWEWEGDFTPCFKISHIRVCNERTVSHFHQYLMYMTYNAAVNNCPNAHLLTFTGQWPVFRKFWQWLAIFNRVHLLKLWTAFLFLNVPHVTNEKKVAY